ncbi:MAG: DUF2860 family protein [Halieaceae bacterium]
MSRPLFTTLLGVASITLGSSLAQAMPPIPSSSGWSGTINLGVGAAQSENNMIDGIASFDLGEDPISSLQDSPGSENLVLPAAQFALAYTLADTRTQFYGGNSTADKLGFDINTMLETRIGIRQELTGIGTVAAALTSSSLPSDVWKDPYIVDQSRGDTELTNSGLYIGWEQIMGTALAFNWTSTETDLDDERSGEALGLNDDQQRLLRRTGDVNRLSLSYNWQINDHSSLVPTIGYLDYDLDGKAMAENGAIVQLKYSYAMERWSFVSQLYYQNLQSDDNNPIYDDEADTDSMGVTVTALYDQPFGLKQWTANATAAYHEEDSNIDFYDSSFGLISFGMLYRFD